ncbi:unnamed protein product, partial [Effrenium voratum]
TQLENLETMLAADAKQAEPMDSKQPSSEPEKRNKAAAMAFRSLFPSLPAVQEQWARKQEEGRSAATKWLNSAMTKSPKSGKWRVRCDESTLSTQHTSTRTSREGAEARGYPRFRAVVLAGGEDAFKAALHAGEIREVKSKTGKALYQWSEEVCEDHHDIQLGAHLSSSLSMDGEDAAAARSEFTDALDAMSFETGLNIAWAADSHSPAAPVGGLAAPLALTMLPGSGGSSTGSFSLPPAILAKLDAAYEASSRGLLEVGGVLTKLTTKPDPSNIVLTVRDSLAEEYMALQQGHAALSAIRSCRRMADGSTLTEASVSTKLQEVAQALKSLLEHLKLAKALL